MLPVNLHTNTHVCVTANTILDYKNEKMLRAQITDSLLLTSNTVTLPVPSSIFHNSVRLSGWRTLELCVMIIMFTLIYSVATQSLSFFVKHKVLKFQTVYFWIFLLLDRSWIQHKNEIMLMYDKKIINYDSFRYFSSSNFFFAFYVNLIQILLFLKVLFREERISNDSTIAI